MPRSYIEIATLEETRQALGAAEVADLAEPIAGGFMCFAGEDSWANQACGLGLSGPVSDGELDPDEDLRQRLPHGWPEGVTLKHVDPADEQEVRTFVEVSSSGFLPEGKPLPESSLEVSRRVTRHPRCDSFLALHDGVPAGGGAMESPQGMASLFGTSVLPPYRQRGIQSALIVRRLERARERGCELACIHALPGIPTERNAVRLVFFLAYTKAIMSMPGEGLRPSP